jgi:putative SOS response-associated peptidase YedK
MPSPPECVKGKADYDTTNIRRPNFGHWRQWLGTEHRCVVAAISFAESSPTPGARTRRQVSSDWFALD